MRFRIFLSLGLSVLVLAGALLLQAELTQSAAAGSHEEDTVVRNRAENILALRLGGAQENLSEALLGAASSRKPGTSGEQKHPSDSDDEAKPLYVRLRGGESVSLLCRREFGSAGAAKVKGVLELNGWSEAEARRLTTGTWVRLR